MKSCAASLKQRATDERQTMELDNLYDKVTSASSPEVEVNSEGTVTVSDRQDRVDIYSNFTALLAATSCTFQSVHSGKLEECRSCVRLTPTMIKEACNKHNEEG